MRIITEDVFSQEFKIYRELAPHKEYKTTLALKEQPSGTIFPVVLKEIDSKRTSIYEMLTQCWSPYMAQIYEVLRVTAADETQPDRYFAVTEYVYAQGNEEKEALSLTQFIEQNGPLSEKQALTLGIQICEGLKPAHQSDLLHRDIKPDNIMMACCDPNALRMKIIDFGGGKQLSKNQLMDTTVVGTVGFQAPESISSGTTERADVYSIGCLLNYMLTGQEPGVVRYQGRHNIVSLIEKATANDPEIRYASVDLLQRWLKHELGVRWIDRVPVLRDLPGFRTGTAWKEVLAGIVYVYELMMLPGMFLTTTLSQVFYTISMFFFIFVWPIIVIFNAGNILRFIPYRIRQRVVLVIPIRVLLIILGIFIFFMVGWVTL